MHGQTVKFTLFTIYLFDPNQNSVAGLENLLLATLFTIYLFDLKENSVAGPENLLLAT